MSYRGLGDSMPWYQFTVRGDGARFFSEQSRATILNMLVQMYVGPQIPATDADGQRIILTPGAPPLGLPTGYQSAASAARAGQTVLALTAFSPTINQTLRLTNALERLPDLTTEEAGYAVLLTPETAQSLSPFEAPPPVTTPAPVPAPLPGLPGVSELPGLISQLPGLISQLPGIPEVTPQPVPGPAPGAETPQPVPGPAPSGGTTPAPTLPVQPAGLFGLTKNQTIVASVVAVGLVLLVLMAGKKPAPGRAAARR